MAEATRTRKPRAPAPVLDTDARIDALAESVEALARAMVAMQPSERRKLGQGFAARLTSRKFLLTVGSMLTIAGAWISGEVNDSTAILGLIGALTAFISGEAFIDARAVTSRK